MPQPRPTAGRLESRHLIRRLIRLRSGVMLRQISRVRASASAVGIHDLRVATRRLQEALDFFGPYLSSRPRRRLSRRARRIRRELGEVRNADVMLDLLTGPGRRLESDDSQILEELRHRLEGEATALRRAAAGRKGMPVPGARRRCRALLASLEDSPSPALLRRGRSTLTARAQETARRIPPALTGNAVALHRLRIALKRYRYTLEILESLGWRRAAAGIQTARGLQNELGQLHDLDVLAALIRQQKSGAPVRALLRRLAGERRSRLDGIRKALRQFDPEEILFILSVREERAP